ncbi:MAG: RidA family protein [Flavobacteriaceae bacterium]|jgi:enamine deaminase RidA (YjgF/YER057c/UK114 family)|nr:RidA family protein [Flavobacteriaceae bacterium]
MKNLFFISLFAFVSCTPSVNTEKKDSLTEEHKVEKQLEKLGIQLPAITLPVANYVSAVRSGNMLYISGAGPKQKDGTYIIGRLGDSMELEQGYAAARLIAINHLAVIKNELGDLDKVKRIVKVLGMVNATADFKYHPKVINGYSDLMVEVFGQKGKHARSAVGMVSLPMGITVEVEMILEVEE